MERDFKILSILLLLMTGCSKVDETDIDSGLLPYYHAFIMEAENRGVQLSEAQLEVSAFIMEMDGIAGQCQHYNDQPDIVVIDKSTWESADAHKKEFLIFHEWGHCILGRSHLDNMDSAGQCESIMHSTSAVCHMEYNAVTRKDYLDELFNL